MGVNNGSAVAISIKRRGENMAKSLDLKALMTMSHWWDEIL